MPPKLNSHKPPSPSDEFQYRDFEFDELLTSFRRVLTNPGEAIARVILIGPPGSGKSFVLNNFQAKIKNRRIINQKTDIELNCININCSNHSSSKAVVLEIIQKIDSFFYADVEECQTAELQFILADILAARKEHLIIIFDNIDSLVEKEPLEVNSLIYGFQRFSEGKSKDEPNLFSQILVAQDIEFLAELDRSVFRKIVSDVIPFEPYSAQQTFNLVSEYIKNNVRKKITEETIWFIAMISQGNMHLSLELVDRADALAQKEHSIVIVPEYVRAVNKTLTDYCISKQKLDGFAIGQKLMLLTIARRFKSSTKAFLNFLDLPSFYISICEEYNQMPLAKLFSAILNDLEKDAMIALHNLDKEILLSLSDISAAELAEHLEDTLKSKRRDKPYFL